MAAGQERRGQRIRCCRLGEEELQTLLIQYTQSPKQKSSCSSESTCLITYIPGHVFREQDEMLKFLSSYESVK
jgi:hypothetical protein